MSEETNIDLGDGQDNPAEAAKQISSAAKQLGTQAAQTAATKGAEATANAAAATVQASVEGGKAVAEVAAGTAAGGPWGAILSAAWAMRHTLFKVMVTSSLLITFVVMAVVSLPSIVFKGPAAVEQGGGTDIHAIYEELAVLVGDCVQAGYDHAAAQVAAILSDDSYDITLSTEATIDYGFTSADYDVAYILAAYAASIGQTGAEYADFAAKLNAVVPRMFPVTYEVRTKTITLPPETEGGESTTAEITYAACTIHPFDNSVILSAFSIDPSAQYGQFNITTGEAIYSMSVALQRTLFGSVTAGAVPPLTDAELMAFTAQLTCSEPRRELLRTALSLVGKVPYFWGGKSAPGWNAEWNTPKLVTSAGSGSTGTVRPFGLDCSGFTDWVYKTALGSSIHAGSANQWAYSTAVSEAELLPGDLGFKQRPSDPGVNHVLLYAGLDSDGQKLWVHCASGSGVILSSPDYVQYFRRPVGLELG